VTSGSGPAGALCGASRADDYGSLLDHRTVFNLPRGPAIVAALFILSVLKSFLVHQYFDRVWSAGLRVRSSLSALVYDKLLRLSETTRAEVNSGRIVNMLFTDAGSVEGFLRNGHLIYSAPLQIIVALALMRQAIMKQADDRICSPSGSSPGQNFFFHPHHLPTPLSSAPWHLLL
jgi:hypothetical protein